MKNRFCILAILLISTVLHYSYTTAFHVEPILSPFTAFLYSFDTGIASFLSNKCDCSEVKSCSCSLQLGGVNARAEISLEDVAGNAIKPTYVLESVIFLGNYKLYEEKTNVHELQQKCSVFEDKDSYVVNKNYCIKFTAEECKEGTKVCANLLIKEARRTLLDQQILCVRNTTMDQ